MLEDIAPVARSVRKVKMLEAGVETSPTHLPINSHISFRPFVEYLKQKLTGDFDTRSRIYEHLIERFGEQPELLKPVSDSEVLDKNRELLDLLGTTLFPVVSEQEKNIFTLALPYHFSVFNYSPPFGKLFLDENEKQFMLPVDTSEDQVRQVQCSLIYDHVLEKFYGMKLNEGTDLVYPVIDKTTGMKRFYKLRYDRRFIDLKLKGELPLIRDCGVCLNTFRILDLEKQLEKMPLNLFEAEGFGVWIAEDVTTQESIEAIKKLLLRQEGCDTTIINELKTSIHALVGLNEVQVGLTPFVKINDRFVIHEACTRHGLMSKEWKMADEESQAAFEMSLGFLSQHPEPVPLSILDEQMTEMAPFLKNLWKEGMRSYISCPILNNDGLLGILELASPIPNQLDQEVLRRLEPAMPLLSLALLKNRDSFNDKIEKLIKEKFTALQPSVEWKFAEAAWEYMHDTAPAGNVVFDYVYPLYGAVDIRNSSIERSNAIQKDLAEQLNLVDLTLNQLQSKIQLPLLEELTFRNQIFRQSLERGLLAEDEVRIKDFLENEVGQVFGHLQKSNMQTGNVVDDYFTKVQDPDGYLYRYRNEYETSMNAINEAVLEALEKEEKVTQQSYPHYFEKYKTDGVEYTIYIGQSIAPAMPFDLLFLRNIRIWQLSSMAEIARVTHRLLPSLKVPLQTTQLILVHGQQISISFRKDERRFDVEGSYNVRYEVMKKRLDKAFVRGTTERLTQPGMIALVYSNPREAQEYQEYISFLQSKKLLMPGLEFLELEELQGVSGLKALRVKVNQGD
ncbi:GAF domain-containing protein [Flavihumibacter solisilvae]|uniref:GAF domain-containing protein n=1 Tax=Flavihumibacter solisilvae TaxID=1349421 RepID=A0A0C1L0I3_9BACT|nr:GAF domain-containing protein [Flavihumibacter solisilvae]KIC93041.1 hypothetical protein OI18_20060 [Flavihumibacter solisilvae]